jgi:excinuclease UvrABC nuclease subunit
VAFLDSEFYDPISKQQVKVGNFKWGVYAFFDYDGEPIYIGQTKEQLRTRIRRHLTNQRTDAVAMSVLDPLTTPP